MFTFKIYLTDHHSLLLVNLYLCKFIVCIDASHSLRALQRYKLIDVCSLQLTIFVANLLKHLRSCQFKEELDCSQLASCERSEHERDHSTS